MAKRASGVTAQTPEIHRQSNPMPSKLVNKMPNPMFVEKKKPTVPLTFGVDISPVNYNSVIFIVYYCIKCNLYLPM